MSSPRVKRVQSLLARELSEIISRDLKDPRVEGVTVIEARATGDLRRAVIYYRIVGHNVEHPEEVAEGLKSASGMIKRLLGERITLKFMPELEFRYDTTFDVAERIEKILKEVLPHGEEEDE